MELGGWRRGLESREGVSWVVEGWVVWPSEWRLLGEVGSLRGEGGAGAGWLRPGEGGWSWGAGGEA